MPWLWQGFKPVVALEVSEIIHIFAIVNDEGHSPICGFHRSFDALHIEEHGDLRPLPLK